MNPTVSIIIPAYQTALYISETLDSVFAQTFTDFEVIVVNDGSPDADQLVQAIAPYRQKIVYLEQQNRGLAGARNSGIRRARGEFVAFLDSDDCWMPNFLFSQMKLFEEMPSLDVVYADAQRFGDPAYAGKTCMQSSPSNGPVTLNSLIKADCQVLVCCTVARKQSVMDAGLFDENYRRCEDYDLWLRILYRGGHIGYQKRVLGRYRTRPGSLSQDAIKMSKAVIEVCEKAARTMTLPEETWVLLRQQIVGAQARIDLEFGKQFLTSGEFDRAKESLTKANNFFHSAKLKLAILGLQFAPSWTRLAVLTRQGPISSR
jgi:Glycosyl transferase family 2